MTLLLRRRVATSTIVMVGLVVLSTAAVITVVGGDILTVGSLNADTFLPVSRLPRSGENLSTNGPVVCDVPGGKGCNQAVAVARMTSPGRTSVFWGQFGCDDAGAALRECLVAHGVDVSRCRRSDAVGSGRGYVCTESDTGRASAVVDGGSNARGWEDHEGWTTVETLRACVRERGVTHVLLQREIPEWVNAAAAAAARAEGAVVLQDAGGEDRPVDRSTLERCDWLTPNETELSRMVASLTGSSAAAVEEFEDRASVVRAARLLQRHGANHVLVTLGAKGCLCVPKGNVDDDEVVYMPAMPVPGDVVDETGAGDCFRAAFAVALSEGLETEQCLRIASAAGALAVTKRGAVPSVPTREEVGALAFGGDARTEAVSDDAEVSVNDGTAPPTVPPSVVSRGGGDSPFPYLFGSRLNSMKDQPDPAFPRTVAGMVARQGTIRGLDLVDFNYPQHFSPDFGPAEAARALAAAGLRAGAVCLRYPHEEFQRGAMTHPDPAVRRRAIDLTKEAADVALRLGCDEVVVWSAYDGYDYQFQVDHEEKWRQIVDAFRECCDAHPRVRFSLEYKPTDENTRFFVVPSTGDAIRLAREVDRPNMGLTLDVGHCLMAGEDPARSVAAAAAAGLLFGMQLNDGHTRLAAEDGLMFGSVHPYAALEIMYQLRRTNYRGHLYFDTFPQRTDPVRECEQNIRRVRTFHAAATRMEELLEEKDDDPRATHDALGALRLMDEALAYGRSVVEEEMSAARA